MAKTPAELAGEAGDGTSPDHGDEDDLDSEARLVFDTVETQTREGTVLIRVRLDLFGRAVSGEAVGIDIGTGRLRAAATATLNAASGACNQRIRFQLDGISPVRAFGREYVLVNVLASSSLLGRKPVPLVAAQPLEDDPDHAAALAALMAINRVFAFAFRKE
jgi:hypothetical protein